MREHLEHDRRSGDAAPERSATRAPGTLLQRD